ncbi:MAG: hypothetical protein V3T81_01930, partial [Thermoanaerobaculia bacterium]
FPEGESVESLVLTGHEKFAIEGLVEALSGEFRKGMEVTVRATGKEGQEETAFKAAVRLDTPNEADYYRHGGILRYVLRQLLGST